MKRGCMSRRVGSLRVFFLFVSLLYILCFFFFSSRRRHTRCSRDWSSDVCSSDLFRIDPGLCVACMACVRVCPADAVAVEGTQIRIVDETCTRCGLCLPACPHDAIKASGDVARASELALSGRAALILSVECAVFFYPATPEQVVNACYATGFRTVHRGVLGDELADLFRRRGVKVESQAPYFTRVPEERRRHLSTAGGLPLELLMEETHASRRFRKVRGLGGLEAIARAVAVDRIDVGFVDILPCEGCLDHPLLGPPNELFRRREIVGATEPARARGPVVEETVARGVRVGEAFPILRNRHRPPAQAVEAVLEEIGLAPNGRPWDCGACGYATCRAFAEAAAAGRAPLQAWPPHLDQGGPPGPPHSGAGRATGRTPLPGVLGR